MTQKALSGVGGRNYFESIWVERFLPSHTGAVYDSFIVVVVFIIMTVFILLTLITFIFFLFYFIIIKYSMLCRRSLLLYKLLLVSREGG